AREFQRTGVRRGDCVLLQGFNGIEWLVAFWALQTLGAVTAFGNAWWSAQETAAAIELARPALLVADRVPEGAAPPSLALVRFADVREWMERGDDAALQIEPVDEESPALVLFSSGTTGHAKGVVMSHRSVI